MKRMIWMAAAAVGILAFAELAQAAGPGPRAGAIEPAGYGPVANPGGRYGFHPFLSRGSWGKKSAGCDTCGGARGTGCGAGGCGAQGPQLGYPGPQLPGTLVFPVNPYLRCPRDFFMVTPR